MRTISRLIIHCSATKEGEDFSSEDINRWHIDRGWKCIGYHYVIRLDGSVERGRPECMIGSHCSGFNRDSIGIVYIGGLDQNGRPKDTRTEKQKESLRNIIDVLREKYDIPKEKVFGHNELNSKKKCPCFNVNDEI